MSISTKVKARFWRMRRKAKRRDRRPDLDIVDGPQRGEAHVVGTIAVSERHRDDGANQSGRDVGDLRGAGGGDGRIERGEGAAQAGGGVEVVVVQWQSRFGG